MQQEVNTPKDREDEVHRARCNVLKLLDCRVGSCNLGD